MTILQAVEKLYEIWKSGKIVTWENLPILFEIAKAFVDAIRQLDGNGPNVFSQLGISSADPTHDHIFERVTEVCSEISGQELPIKTPVVAHAVGADPKSIADSGVASIRSQVMKGALGIVLKEIAAGYEEISNA